MALRNSAGTAGTTPAATPAFEAPETFDHDLDTMVVEEPVTTEPVVERMQQSQPQATAVAPARSTAVGAAKKLVAAYSEFENVISLDDVEAMGVGAFPRVTVDTGGFSLDNADLGKEIRIELMSWNNRFMVVPGAKDEESKKLVKISYDGITISGTGELVKDYLAHLKAEGYAEAEMKQYVDLWGSMTYASGAEVAPDDRKIVQVQLSPQSVKQFKAFQVQVGWNLGRGSTQDTSLLFLRAEKKELNGDRFGIVRFALK